MSTHEPTRREHLNVLLVEDDDADALLFEELLERARLEATVRRARTLAEAEDGLARRDASCVVLDLGLPDAEGLSGLRRLCDAAPDVPVLVLTGGVDGTQGLEALAAGAQDYLIKGRVEPELLGRSIRYAVERRRSELVQAQLRAVQLTATESARLERGLLPRPLVSDRRVTIATGYRPGRARTLLGGDFYDAVECDDGTLHAVVGDVCGHDPDAAALGVCLRIAWRALVLGGRADDELLTTLEQVLVHERVSEEVFATVCMITIGADRRSACVRVAGHPPPILLTDEGADELPTAVSRPPLGVGLTDAWPSLPVELPPAWRLLLYTDGLIEGRVNGGDERLGTHRLVALAAEHDAAAGGAGAAVIDGLIGAARELNGGDLTDDVAALLISLRDGDG
jgi:serine phosphatase RsbU (regulator of sigma subunit)